MITAMGRLALVGTHGIEATGPWAQAERREIDGEHGAVGLLDAGDYVVLPRHGIDGYRPPHLIDHPRNLGAVIKAGCDRVLGICSVGALHEELAIGTFVCPDDFIAPGSKVVTFDDERDHVVPAFDIVWRRLALEGWSTAAGIPIRDGGVYWQSLGPQFETPAEVRLIAAHADLVGMTMATECTTASQMELAYAAICVVDNLANGVGETALTAEEYLAGHRANLQRLGTALEAVLPGLAAEPQ
jgi:purine nucleoside phosphorylase